MIIYMYTNKLNGKSYIGQTIREFNIRHREHLRANISYFDRALSKYGEDNFSREIIYEASSIEDLNEKEIDFIQRYKTLKPNGYNITNGGDSFSGYSHTGKTKIKISKALKSYHRENPTVRIGESNPAYGIAWSEKRKVEMSDIKSLFWKNNSKAREEMSEIKKQYYREHPEARKIKSEQTKEWIAKNGHPLKGRRHTDESKAKMSESLKGRKMSEEAKIKISKNSARKREVINLDTGEIFSTVRAAAESVEKNKSSISNVCRGAKNKCGGYRWAYLDEHQIRTDKERRKG